MCWSNSSKTLSWLGVLWGLLSLATLLTAFLSNVWLYTKEPIRFPNNDILTTVTFKIGLWRICPSFKRTNGTPYVANPPCTNIKYSSWEDITASDLGLSSPLEFTPSFVSKMRISTPFGATSMGFILLATVFALAGLYSSDHKTLVACGLYMLGGLTLGGGLLIFASVLSDAYLERPRRSHVINDGYDKMTSSSLFDYKYGWSFFAAGAAFFMSELAAVLSISAYMRRFPTVEDMVRVMVPGAERRLKERHGLAGEYLVQHQNKYQMHEPDPSASLTSGLSSKCYSKSEVLAGSELDGIEGPVVLTKPAPDICALNTAVVAEDVISFANPPSASSSIIAAPGGGYCLKSEPPYLLDESNAVPSDSCQMSLSKSCLAGQTVPIVVMHHSQKPPGPSYTLPGPDFEGQRGFKTSNLPISEDGRPIVSTHDLRRCAGTLPRHICTNTKSEIPTLDRSLRTKKFKDLEEHLGCSQRLGYGLSHLSPEIDPGTSAFFGTFHGDGTFIQPGLLGTSLEIPGTSSTTSSSSGGTGSGMTTTTGSSLSSTSRKNFPNVLDKKKKKTVTIGNVFSTMDTFESDRTDDDLFDSGSAV